LISVPTERGKRGSKSVESPQFTHPGYAGQRCQYGRARHCGIPQKTRGIVSRIWLTFIQPEGTDPLFRRRGVYLKADHLPIQDDHRVRGELLCG